MDLYGALELLSPLSSVWSEQRAIQAVFLLFLSGAANRGTPESLGMTVLDLNGNEVKVVKGDIMFFYRTATGNQHLRRLAESVADEISTFAETHNLSGDLANQINRQIIASASDENPTEKLNRKEKAWCWSFNQDNPKLETDPNLKRLGILLAKDLENKFSSKKKQASTKGKATKKAKTAITDSKKQTKSKKKKDKQ